MQSTLVCTCEELLLDQHPSGLVKYRIQKDGTKGDAMMFDKILAIQQQNSAEMRNLMKELNQERAEEAKIHREETQLLMNELRRTQA